MVRSFYKSTCALSNASNWAHDIKLISRGSKVG